MISLGGLFNKYERKARLYPGLITLAPILVLAAAFWREQLTWIWPIAASLGGLFFLAHYVRGRGQTVEQRLVRRWDGMPTTRLLRWRTATNSVTRQRRRTKLEAIQQRTLPDQLTEQQDPKIADEHYVDATRALIVRLRSDEKRFGQVLDENIGYGFRRNLYALKPVALTLLAFALIADASIMGLRGFRGEVATVAVIHLLLTLAWLSIVRASWVRQAGETYAERLFEALDDL
ncbi:hypothetical protein [Fodinicola acaciae]|uniref:hypothetical protein n=1 Tax=Fodinicola acaciae TaxID=2681555 RepID=UPI0013D239D5|nr:hypothetical protein [Fodinicola acaciae]